MRIILENDHNTKINNKNITNDISVNINNNDDYLHETVELISDFLNKKRNGNYTIVH